MEKLPVNPNCELSGTKYCRALNMGACERCTVRNSDRKDEIRADIELYETLLPAGGVAHLFTDSSCALCKQEPRGACSGYAIIDMAHPEPKRVQRWLLGKKVSSIGTMIPVQMSVCGKCRRTLMCIDYLPLAAAVVIGLAGLFLLGSGAIADVLAGVSAFLPFAAWLVVAGLGLLAGRLIAKALAKRADARMYVRVLEHPTLAEMVQKGWTPVSNARNKVLFSKSRIARGLGTASDAHTECLNPAESAQNGQNS